MSDTSFHILSLDGGGLKGLFAASFLVHWERETGRSVADSFDLIVGTSTGGIIALALGIGMPANEILSFYRNEARTIFPDKAFARLKHFFAVKHSAKGLESALEKHFSNRILGDSRKRLVIPAFNPKCQAIHLYKTPHHPRLRYDWKEKIVDVARATAAAPTFLAPFVKKSGLQLIDGGMFANNPIMIGIAECLGYLKIPQHSIAALRIGTTSEVAAMNRRSTSGGTLAMAGPVVDYMFAGQAQCASGMASHILNGRYCEVNPKVAPRDFQLDTLAEDLIGLGETEFRTHCSDLAERGFLNYAAQTYNPYYS
jgi:patatin-like phospholipase/acyl hydrolase